MIVAHIMGIPVEETAVQLAAGGAVTVGTVTVVARSKLRRILDLIRRH